MVALNSVPPKAFDSLSVVYHQPLFSLLEQSRQVHRTYWGQKEGVQLCRLLSIKTGGCSEDCGYCAQSARYDTGVKAERLMDRQAVLEEARQAKQAGAGRFCMGAAWKGVREGEAKFESVLDIIRDVKQLGMEVCVTLGQLTDEAARQLKADTSPDHYRNIVTTHSFEDRLRTIRSVQRAGMSVCCGGILGMGESEDDRLKMLEVLCGFDPSPESVPINCLMPQEGTPLAGQKPIDVFELVRLIATTRIALPRARVRLSAGRTALTREAQALCFFAGANSIFFGDKLLTAPNPEESDDRALLRTLGLAPA
ncbi:biotin synthase BioB [bacterium]|nr:biotin synthase BioB [bacterium]